MKIVDALKKLQFWQEIDPMPEGVMAHNIQDPKLRQEIVDRYNELFRPEPTPFTHPENYDPLNPPQGWAYDPFYECWIEVHGTR